MLEAQALDNCPLTRRPTMKPSLASFFENASRRLCCSTPTVCGKGSAVYPPVYHPTSITPRTHFKCPFASPQFLKVFATYLTLPTAGAAEANPLLNTKLRLAAVKAEREAELNNLGRTIVVINFGIKSVNLDLSRKNLWKKINFNLLPTFGLHTFSPKLWWTNHSQPLPWS